MNSINENNQYEKVVRIIFVFFPSEAFTATDIKNVAKIPSTTAHAQIVRLYYQGLIVKDSHISEYHYRVTPDLINICVDFLLGWVPKGPKKRKAICQYIVNFASDSIKRKFNHCIRLVNQKTS